ncbi:MAG: hypothetical protein E7269_04855 [Lachnospiraceae bacterium]|nr:hypothetical protein [Lachnospiraceae bacterium]
MKEVTSIATVEITTIKRMHDEDTTEVPSKAEEAARLKRIIKAALNADDVNVVSIQDFELDVKEEDNDTPIEV